jgi:predicted Rossmann fold nucleotide-binding protein DprA/Smf involved in DNA uptake
MNDSTRASLLLCAVLAADKPQAAALLSTGEYHRLLAALTVMESEVASLIGEGSLPVLEGLAAAGWDRERLAGLLAREEELNRAIELWEQIELRTVSFLDQEYPTRLRERLRTAAPPVLFVVGSGELLARGGLAVVGSRNTDEAALKLAAELATLCAEQDVTVISGGARGVDQTAMVASLEANGRALGLLADSLAREAVSEKYHVHLDRRHVTLASSCSPEAPFSVGNAMSRNKLIYALSDAAFVVSAEAQTGGTWHGAVENLKQRWTPLLVRRDDSAPRGNDLLIRRGGVAVDPQELNSTLDIRSWFAARPDSDGLSLFSE